MSSLTGDNGPFGSTWDVFIANKCIRHALIVHGTCSSENHKRNLLNYSYIQAWRRKLLFVSEQEQEQQQQHREECKKQLRVIRDNKGKSISHRRLTRHLLSVWIVLCVWPFVPEIPADSWRTLSESVLEQHTFAVFALATWATSPKRSVRFLIASVKAGVDGADFPFWFFFEGGCSRRRERLNLRIDLSILILL